MEGGKAGTNMNENQVQQWMKDNLFKLKTLRDEIRVELHLAGMEAKDKFKEIEPLVKNAEKLAGDVSEVSRHAMAEILEKFEQFRRNIKSSFPRGPSA